MTLPGHFHLVILLVKLTILFNAQQKTNCEVLSTDTCTAEKLDLFNIFGEIARVDVPMHAGKEGIDLRHGGITTMTAVKKQNPKNTTWSVKFYVTIEPQNMHKYYIFAFNNGPMLSQLANGSFVFELYTDSAAISVVFDYPEEGVSESPADDSDWIELVGIKMKISNKREATSDSSGWKMIGLEYSKYLNEEGYVRIYMDGKLLLDSVIQRHDAVKVQGQLAISYGVFSCFQYHTGKMGDVYFKDPNLNECKEKYEGQSQEKFVECQKQLADRRG